MARRNRGANQTSWAWIGAALAASAAMIAVIPTMRRRPMKVTNILKKDHRVVNGMIRALEMTPKMNRTLRNTIFNEIHRQVTMHAQAEEDVFYPAVRNLNFGYVEQYVN